MILRWAVFMLIALSILMSFFLRIIISTEELAPRVLVFGAIGILAIALLGLIGIFLRFRAEDTIARRGAIFGSLFSFAGIFVDSSMKLWGFLFAVGIVLAFGVTEEKKKKILK